MNHFRSGHLADDLGRKAVRAGALSGAGHAAQFLALCVGTVVLARLLTPEDYGLVTMVTAFTSIVASFKDLGLAASTVQRAEIDHQQTSALFWVNVGFGLLLAILVAATAPALAWFYDEPRVRWMTVAMASTFLFSGLTTQHHSLLSRQLRFGEVAVIEFLATVLAVAVAIVAAANGAEYWALVLMHALTPLLAMAGVWWRCSWRPGRPARAHGMRAMLSYGGYLTGFNLVTALARSFDRLLIGWSASAGPLGLYSRASFLVTIPTVRFSTAATAVAIPVLSRLQDDPGRYRAFVIMAVLLFGSITVPLGFFVFAAAGPIVLVLLGAQWAGTAPILQALAPFAVFAALEAAMMWVTTSTGHTRRQFFVGAASAIAAVVAMSIGMRWGVVGVAIGFSVAQGLMCTVGLAYCLQPVALRFSDILLALWRPALASAAAAVATVAVNRAMLGGRNAMVVLAWDVLVFTATYLLCWCIVPRGLATMREMVLLARTLRN